MTHQRNVLPVAIGVGAAQLGQLLDGRLARAPVRVVVSAQATPGHAVRTNNANRRTAPTTAPSRRHASIDLPASSGMSLSELITRARTRGPGHDSQDWSWSEVRNTI